MTTSAGYEFTAAENETFKGLVRNLSRSGVVVILASLILLAYHFMGHFGVSLGATPPPIVYYCDLTAWCLISVLGAVVGVLLIRVTAAFRAVIHTQGDDVAHLMRGMTRLDGILTLIFWAASAASVLLATSFAFLLIYA